MFLRSTNRRKDGKDHRYFSVVENRRLPGGKTVQRTVLYLGEINDQQQAAWRKTLEVFDEAEAALHRTESVSRRSGSSRRCRRQRAGETERAGTAASAHLRQLLAGVRTVAATGADEFWRERLPEGRETVSWEKVLRLLVVNRLLDPGSEFRVHRQWFVESAMDELLEEDFAVAEKDRLYRCLDRVLEHKQELFVWLKQKWADLFQRRFRSAALRSDQYVLRRRDGAESKSQARLQPGRAAGLCATGDRAGGDAGRLSAGL